MRIFSATRFTEHAVSRYRTCMLALTAMLVLLSNIAHAQVVQNVNELGFIDLNFRSPDDNSVAFVWGFVHEGKEFAAVPITDGGVSIVEVTNPAAPAEVAFIAKPPGSDRLYHLKYYKGYIYVVMRPGPMQIIDVRDPYNPVVAGNYQVNFDGVYSLFISDSLIHLSDTDGAPDDKKSIFLDISDPVNPVEVGSWFRGYHQSFIRGDTLFGWNFAGYCEWLDISDIANITSFKQWEVGDQSHSGWLSDDGTKLTSDQELPGGFVKIWDITGAGTPVKLGEFATATNGVGETSVHHSMWYDDLLYMSYWRDGFRVVDASDPAAPVQVGAFDNDDPNTAGLLRGGWMAYPYLPSRNIIYSDRKRGLYVLDYTGDGPGLEHFPLDSLENGNNLLTGTVKVINGNDLDSASSSIRWRQKGTSAWQEAPLVADTVALSYTYSIPVPAMAEKLEYYFEVKDNSGRLTRAPGLAPWQDMYETAIDTTTPPIIAPTGLLATASGDSLIDLSWQDESGNEDGFRIERRPVGGIFALLDSAAADTGSFADTTVASATTYEYRIFAYDSSRQSAFSNVATATTASGANDPPIAVSNLTASVLNDSTIELSWTDNSDYEIGMRIERRLIDSSFAEIDTVMADSTSYTDVGLAIGTTYEYQVIAYNDNGDAPASNIASATTTEPNTPPDAIATAAPDSGQAPLTVDFTGSGSTDSTGIISSYLWYFGDGDSAAVADTSHTYDSTGTYIAELIVTDGGGLSDTAAVTITVTAPPPNQPPLAMASADPDSGQAPLTVNFTGSGSTDSTGTITNYLWYFGDGDSAAVADTSHTYAGQGTYNAELIVTDDGGLMDTATVAITVSPPPPNEPPVAVATADPDSGTAPLTVNFTGSGSTDSTGIINSYLWYFGDGDSAAVADTSHTYSGEGTYNAELIVTDDGGLMDTATVAITVSPPPPNAPPIATISASPDSGEAPLAVTFTGSGSSDSDGSIISYLWYFGDGDSAAVADTSHTYDVVGSYTAELIVTDDGGAKDTASVVITASTPPVNQAPNVTITAPTEGQIFSPGGVISFTGDATDPEDGTVPAADFTWIINGPGVPVDYVLATGTKSTSGTPPQNGDYEVRLEVVDSEGLAASDTVNFSVQEGGGNQSPTAVATADPTSGDAPLPVNFDGSTSSDPDGTISSYSWDFGDGSASSSQASPSYTYNSAGTYTATLTVTDNDGATGTDTAIITVSDPGGGNTPPVPTISQPASGANFSAGQTINFAGDATDAEDGTIPAADFTWTVLAPDGIWYALTTGSKTGSSVATFPGPYTIRLEVTDSGGLSAIADRNIQVTGAAKLAAAGKGLMLLGEVPDGYALYDVSPNPFNPVTRIRFDLPESESVSLRVYNSSGRKVRTLHDGSFFPPGQHKVRWDGRDDQGRFVASGVYVIRISAGPLRSWKKASLVK